MTGNVLCGDQLLDRFKELLKTARSVDIATAWATPGPHLQAISDTRGEGDVKVRAIVGISGNATHPDALRDLDEITVGDLRIVPKGDRLFHPKLYLFELRVGGNVERRAWIGSANFTRAGFGGRSAANEEVVLEVGPGERADALADWFQDRWDRCRKDPDEIRRYEEDWNRNPPHRQLRRVTSGAVSRRKDLLDYAHRPLTLEGYHRALKECEERLRVEGRGWGVLNPHPQGRSYMRVIKARSKLLLGATSWSKLDADSERRLKGSYRRKDLEWWGLMGRLGRGNWPAVCRNERRIRGILDAVWQAPSDEFPDIAVDAMRELTDIDNLGHGTATLVLALARPDRLLSLNRASQNGLGALASKSPSTLGNPENYRELLAWLYEQPWYVDGPPPDGDLARIWRFRAALVDSFVYEPT